MKLNIIIVFAIITIGVAVYAYTNQSPPQKAFEKNPALDFSTITLNGEPLTLSQFEGQKIYLHFWATWCAPCIVEIPEIVKFAENSENIVVAIAVENKPDDVKNFLENIDLNIAENFIIGLDPDWQIARELYGSRKLPETFIISSDFHVERHIIGSWDKWEEAHLLQ
ncbi:MAG: TlpA disulfide reductase family protein [Pseudomonadota bacterium]